MISGYRLAMGVSKVETTAGEGSSKNNGDNFWSLIWRLKVANKIKIFIWKACNNFIVQQILCAGGCIGSNAHCTVRDVGAVRNQVFMLYGNARQHVKFEKKKKKLSCTMFIRSGGNRASKFCSFM